MKKYVMIFSFATTMLNNIIAMQTDAVMPRTIQESEVQNYFNRQEDGRVKCNECGVVCARALGKKIKHLHTHRIHVKRKRLTQIEERFQNLGLIKVANSFCWICLLCPEGNRCKNKETGIPRHFRTVHKIRYDVGVGLKLLEAEPGNITSMKNVPNKKFSLDESIRMGHFGKVVDSDRVVCSYCSKDFTSKWSSDLKKHLLYTHCVDYSKPFIEQDFANLKRLSVAKINQFFLRLLSSQQQFSMPSQLLQTSVPGQPLHQETTASQPTILPSIAQAVQVVPIKQITLNPIGMISTSGQASHQETTVPQPTTLPPIAQAVQDAPIEQRPILPPMKKMLSSIAEAVQRVDIRRESVLPPIKLTQLPLRDPVTDSSLQEQEKNRGVNLTGRKRTRKQIDQNAENVLENDHAGPSTNRRRFY